MIKIGPINLSRRTMLRAFAVGAVAGIGSVALSVRGPNGLIDNILNRGIGPFSMTPADKKQLHEQTRAYLSSEGAKDLSVRIMAAGYAALNFPYVRHLLPEDSQFKIEQLERQVVTFFLLSTDYLTVADGKFEDAAQADIEVSYTGYNGICTIPWAKIA